MTDNYFAVECWPRNLIAAYRQTRSQNRIYEAGVGVKRELSKLCPGRQTSVVAGDSKTMQVSLAHDLS
jgi:hypothetical protein